MRVPTLTPLERGLILYLIAMALLLALAWGVNAWIAAAPARPIGSALLAPFAARISLWL
jgi:hypothetical protein